MTKLNDLSPQALGNLLGIPTHRAREWLDVARAVFEDPSYLQVMFDDSESSSPIYLRRSLVRELMELTVEEVVRSKRTGEFYLRYPQFKRRAPKEANTRLRYLRQLLTNEPDFETRFPVAYELLFGASSASSGLLLPSFGVRVPVRIAESAPRASVLPAGWHQDWKRSQDSGDAFSLTTPEKIMRGEKEVDRAFASPGLGYMRGVLLAVLNREEYAERIATELHSDTIREELGAPAQAPVRITDLRLATAPELRPPGSLKAALRSELRSLEEPITPDGVLRWKWAILQKDGQVTGQEPEDKLRKIARVSFCAAALLLFLDFDTPGIERASALRIATHVDELAAIIRTLSKSVDVNAKKLEKLLAYRARNRPPTPGQKVYEALVAFRMGKKPCDIAKSLAINPYHGRPSESEDEGLGGTREWKRRLEERLERGARIEEEKYPRAASVFRHRHKPRIARKARLAYRAYEEETTLFSEEEHSPWPGTGQRVHVNASTDWGLEVAKAYVQLGSCLKRRLEPFPTRKDFGT